MPDPATLDEWLAHCERLHPKTIDMTLQRVSAVRERLGLRFQVPVVAVAGTNGKGSSCAMLESIARQAGYRVGLYIKPHLVHFEERCRIDGRSVQAQVLLPHFAAVEAARGDITLTYFEFTTLAIMHTLSLAELDLVILEVGLGGRLDAVNAVDADCALITSIDLDHMDYLGPDRESIGFEKAGILRRGKPAVVSDPVPPASLLRHAQELGVDLWLVGRDFSHRGDRQQWSWAGRSPPPQRAGLSGAARCEPVAQRQRRAGGVRGPARTPADQRAGGAQRLGHGGTGGPIPDRAGPAGAGAGRGTQPAGCGGTWPSTSIRWASFRARMRCSVPCSDKDIPGMLSRLAPLVDRWYLCDLPLPRAATAQDLAGMVKAAGARLRRGTRAATNRRPPHCAPRSPRPTRLIESWSSVRSSASVAC